MFRKRAPAPKVGQTPLRMSPRLTRSFIGTVRYHPSSVSLICLKHPIVRMMPNWPQRLTQSSTLRQHKSAMTPISISPTSWRSHDAAESLAPTAGAHNILQNLPKLLISNHEGVCGRRSRMRQPIADFDARKLWLISPKQVIPDHQHAAKILVDVFKIACMVHAVGGWRVDDPIQQTDPLYQLSMEKKLIGQTR